jgi:hypothetical protein
MIIRKSEFNLAGAAIGLGIGISIIIIIVCFFKLTWNFWEPYLGDLLTFF